MLCAAVPGIAFGMGYGKESRLLAMSFCLLVANLPGLPAVRVSCPKGQYLPHGTSTCNSCWPGSFQPELNKPGASCKTCPAGWYAPCSNSSACDKCSSNLSNDKRTECVFLSDEPAVDLFVDKAHQHRLCLRVLTKSSRKGIGYRISFSIKQKLNSQDHYTFDV